MALGKSLRELDASMDGRELQEWLVISNHFLPLPNPWLQTGVIAAATANFSGNVKPSHYPVKAESFVPRARRRVAWQAQQAKMRAYAARHPQQKAGN